MMNDQERRLFVAWRRPDRNIVPVGLLTQQVIDGALHYRFQYLKVAERQTGFLPLPGLPDLHVAYQAPALFPVFANRVMPRDRPDYADFLEQLDLDSEADPFEVLERSEGIRATDRVEVFPVPRSVDGQLTTLFFARGIRHREGADRVVDTLAAGDELTLQPQPDNDFNPRAILMNTRTGECVGWAPDYLLDLIHELQDLNGAWPAVTVEHVNNSEVPPHLRLLCRLTSPWPQNYAPFSGPDFQPIAS